MYHDAKKAELFNTCLCWASRGKQKPFGTRQKNKYQV